MNRPRRPDAEWIAEVRAHNRARQGLPVSGALGRHEEDKVPWKAVLVVVGLGFLLYNLLPRG